MFKLYFVQIWVIVTNKYVKIVIKELNHQAHNLLFHNINWKRLIYKCIVWSKDKLFSIFSFPTNYFLLFIWHMSIIYFGLIVKSCFDIIHLTGVFYQKILQHILNGNFVYLTFLTLRMSLFENFMLDDILMTL